MKILRLAFVFSMLFSMSEISAQEGAGLTFKRLFMDYQTLNGGDFGAFKDYTSGFEVGYFFPIMENLEVYIPLKVGLGNRSEERINNRLIGLDIQGQYHFLQNPKTFSPYALAGIGGVLENKDSFNLQIPLGLGFDVKIAPNAYFNWQSEFRPSTLENHSNFHHGLGFRYVFGGNSDMVEKPKIEMPELVDTDMDGITDNLDKCPLIPGLAAFEGCPDKDNDGVQDSEDRCPDFPGLKELNGCPDTDGDGVSDMEDECPNMAGLIENKGCPSADTDGDGVLDEMDACPEVKGLINLAGCPDSDNDGIIDNEDDCPYDAGLSRFRGCPDTDGDGVIDKSDLCPNAAGSPENNGCPDIAKADRETLEFAMKAVEFETGKALLKRESFTVLNQIADIMSRYPDYSLEISGHTDNVGTETNNQRLSEQRARTCYEYLAGKGVTTRRMTYVGHGEVKPIADNDTATGKTLNRRVEFDMQKN